MAIGEQPAVGGDRMAARQRNATLLDERPALPLATESERFELTDDLEGKRIIEFKHIDVVTIETSVSERSVGGAATHQSIDVASSPNQVPGRWHLVGRAEKVRSRTEQMNGRDRRVDAVGARDDEGATSFGRHGAVQQMEWVGDHW